MSTVNAFLARIQEAGWRVEPRPMSPYLTPQLGDVATTHGDPTAYHVDLITTKAARLVSDEGDITVWVNPDDVNVAARRTNGIWCDVRPQQGPVTL